MLTQYRLTSPLAKLLRKRAGAYLKGLRNDAGLTQAELAKRLDLDYYTFISQIELGTARVPSELIEPYARALGRPVQEVAKQLLFYLDPYMYRALFDDEDPVRWACREAEGDPAASRTRRNASPDEPVA